MLIVCQGLRRIPNPPLFKELKQASPPDSLQKKYNDLKCWGLLASLDLHACRPEYIRQPKKIREFVVKLCDSIGMKRYGPTMIKRFGEGELEGYSALQFIETSSVTIHFDETKDRTFVEIFSCKYFDPKVVRRFCQEFLESRRSKLRYFFRY